MLKKIKLLPNWLRPSSKKFKIVLIVFLGLILIALSLYYGINREKSNTETALENYSRASSSGVDLEHEINQISQEIELTSDVDKKVDLLYYNASRYQELEQYDRAIGVLDKITLLKEPDFYLYEMYGDMYLLKKDVAQSESYYSKAIDEVRKEKIMDPDEYEASIEYKKRIYSGEPIGAGRIPG